jgi:hypothetical protein
MDPTKERIYARADRRNELRVKGGTFVWGLRPQPPGIYRVDANPSEISLPLGLSSALAPAWSWPRSRRYGCLRGDKFVRLDHFYFLFEIQQLVPQGRRTGYGPVRPRRTRVQYTTCGDSFVPADRFKSLASRALGLWRVVKLFREVGFRGIPSTTDAVRAQTTRILEALDFATRTLSEINEPGYKDKILADTVKAAKSAATLAIDKTSVVLGHSILDDVVTECCHLSALLMPASWMGFIEGRKVALSEVLQTPAADIAQQLLADYLDQLGRESLLKRVEILNQKYQPAPPFQFDSQPYKFDRERLLQIDQHRQRIIHQLELSGSGENRVLDDLLYLEATCFYFIFIVSNKHAISIDPMSDVLDALGSKASSPFKLAYEALLLATSLPAPDEEVWSRGGRVFARDGTQRSRQLPLLMPAVHPNLSSDRRRLVFIKYRRTFGQDLSPEDHIYGRRESMTADIWISEADGSRPEVVLNGSPQSEGKTVSMSSPQFDPEGKLVYYLAHVGLATSLAIFVLDLETRQVTEFTDSLGFVVLHGEPYKGHLLVGKHRYYGPPNHGSYDHLWLVSPTAEVLGDFGEDLDSALVKLYGLGGRNLAFPHLD